MDYWIWVLVYAVLDICSRLLPSGSGLWAVGYYHNSCVDNVLVGSALWALLVRIGYFGAGLRPLSMRGYVVVVVVALGTPLYRTLAHSVALTLTHTLHETCSICPVVRQSC